MEFKELLKLRRSCRSYLETNISDCEIKELIETCLLAPSWKNSETGRYYVANSLEAIKEIYESLPGFNQTSSKNAAYIIATFKKGLSGDGNDYWGAYDLGLQNAYLCLKASEMGYDTLIMGLRDEERIRKYFDIPEDEMILPVIAIGKRGSDCVLRARKAVDEVLKIK